jgi:cytosine/adenosine deaminase-related metal-dependent hydrolase
MQYKFPAVVNSHAHSPYGPHYTGTIASQPMESFMVDISLRHRREETPVEAKAFAFVTGIENLSCGSASIIDQCYLPLTNEHYHAVANAYKELGMRAWVFSELSDLSFIAYTEETYPKYPNAVNLQDLPKELQALYEKLRPIDYVDQLEKLEVIIKEWQGSKVRIGVGISNPVWCSDDLLRGAAELARNLNVPVNFHISESPIQREVHLAQWGTSAAKRVAKLGLLTSETLVTHAVQVDDSDISVMAKSGCSMSHNPISNLKIRNGIAPIGKMVSAGINVCLGCDGQSSADTQNLFTVIKVAGSLSDQNGLGSLPGKAEDYLYKMAIQNGHKLWFEGDLSSDYIELNGSIEPYGFVWDDPAYKITEVYIDGNPCLESANNLVNKSGAHDIVTDWRNAIIEPALREHAESIASISNV